MPSVPWLPSLIPKIKFQREVVLKLHLVPWLSVIASFLQMDPEVFMSKCSQWDFGWDLGEPRRLIAMPPPGTVFREDTVE